MKGVILAAGYGSRFLPASKTIPKEMFPLLNKPAIDFILEEFAEAGITEVLLVTSRRKKTLEDYFDREVELETVLGQQAVQPGAAEKWGMRVMFIRQERMLGAGDALLLCEPFVGKDPFVVAYPDDVFIGKNPSKDMIALHKKTGANILGAQELPINEDSSRYGVLETALNGPTEHLTSIVEKPAPGTTDSRLVSYGRYLFTTVLFPALHATRDSTLKVSKEFTQTEAISQLAEKHTVLVQRIAAHRYDLGTPEGYLKAIMEYAVTDPRYRDYCLTLCRQLLDSTQTNQQPLIG